MENEISFDNETNSAASSDVESGSLKSPKATIGAASPTSNPMRRQKSPGHSSTSVSTSDADSWSSDIERILQDIRTNAEILSRHHKTAYIRLQSQLVYFRVPLIIISAVNSVFSVGLTNYIEQDTVSTLNCLLSLSCACISSLELFLQIQKKLEVELNSYHGYYLLGTRISAMLKLDRDHREIEGITFLNSTVNEYNNLFEQSCVDNEDFTDELVAFEGAADGKTSPHNLKSTKRKP